MRLKLINDICRECLSIEEFNLPEVIRDGLLKRGIRYFTPPQTDALRAGLLNLNDNVLVVAPTASGKTLIAELALVNAALHGGIGIYATPLKALASEKLNEFNFWSKYGLSIGISTGDYDEPGESLGRYDILVTTYEKLDSILRHRPSWLDKVKVLVVDELHNVQDDERGPIIELICARALLSKVQIIGLSATIGEPEVIARWLNAKLIHSDWRPVKLIEGYYDRRRGVIKFIDGRVEEVRNEVITHCVKHAVENDYQLLIFKQSRKQAEALASKISEQLKKFYLSSDLIKDLIIRLREESPSRSEFESLSKLLTCGASYHHAGLSLPARRVVEEGFRSRLIKVLVATPTLAAGINLPARRVLVYTKRFEEGYLKSISVMEYKQMAGRAGRPQYDPFGEAIIADASGPSEAMRYIGGVVESVKSALTGTRSLRTHILASVASGYVVDEESLMSLLSKTLAFATLNQSDVRRRVSKVVESLEFMNMIRVEGRSLKSTELGVITSKLYVDPMTVKVILDCLKGVENVKDIYYLHSIAITPDFNRVRVLGYGRLEEEALSAQDLGLIPSLELVKDVDYDTWLRGYKVALILNDWINEVDEDTIAFRYDVGVGDLTTLVETATWLVYAASVVCSTVGLKEHSTRLSILAKRIDVGVKEDVLELTLVKGIGRVRARVLANSGIRSLDDLASADVGRISRLYSFNERLAQDVVNQAKELIRLR